MRKYISVLGLWARSAFWGAVGILCVMAGAELALLRRGLGAVSGGNCRTYAELVENIHMGTVYLLALAALAVWLIIAANGRETTMGRLSVSMNVSGVLYGVCALLWLIVMWGTQLAVALAGFRMFLREADPASVSGQTGLIAFYTAPELNWLLPMEDVGLWLTHAAVLVTLAGAIGADARRVWLGGRFPLSTLVSVGAAALCFNGGGAALVICAIVFGITVLRFLPGGKEDDGL